MKAAMTLDGQLAASDGTSQWITSAEARIDAHERRAAVDAIMVGAGTLIADDPLLTVRLDGYNGEQPTPVVVAGSRDLPSEARLFARDPIVLTPHAMDVPGRVVVVPGGSGDQVDLDRVDLERGLELLHGLGIRSILVEGGGGLFASLLGAGLIDRGVVYYGQNLAGGTGTPLFGATWDTLSDMVSVEVVSVVQVGGDIRVEFEMVQ